MEVGEFYQCLQWAQCEAVSECICQLPFRLIHHRSLLVVSFSANKMEQDSRFLSPLLPECQVLYSDGSRGFAPDTGIPHIDVPNVTAQLDSFHQCCTSDIRVTGDLAANPGPGLSHAQKCFFSLSAECAWKDALV